MERYTCFENGKWCLRVGNTEHSGPWVDRLAAYEDTGLEPVQVKALGAKMMQIYSGTAEDIILDMKLLADHMECEKYRAIGTVKELSALVEARDEGRVVMLPEDGMLYHFEEIPETGERWVSNKPIQRITFTCGFGLVGIPFDFSQLGKTVFLTRAEAEAALGGGGDG